MVHRCKVSPLVWSIFIGQNADLTSELDCTLNWNYGLISFRVSDTSNLGSNRKLTLFWRSHQNFFFLITPGSFSKESCRRGALTFWRSFGRPLFLAISFASQHQLDIVPLSYAVLLKSFMHMAVLKTKNIPISMPVWRLQRSNVLREAKRPYSTIHRREKSE